MSLIVVSDCSPIRALHHLSLLHICQKLYGVVIVPEAVRAELLIPTTTCPAINITNFEGFEVRMPFSTSTPPEVPDDLDPGETQAIALALELHADLILMDERKATMAARQIGLSTIGVVGVLLDAKRHRLIPKVLPCVDCLISELHFFIGSELRQRLAMLTGE